MTAQEMLEMRISGATYQQIADACGCSKQNAQDVLSRYIKKLKSGYRSHGFYVFDIKFEGIRKHFEDNPNETITSFSKKVGVIPQTMRNFLVGATDSHFSIPQIKRICEIVGKPFEEVFVKDGADNE